MGPCFCMHSVYLCLYILCFCFLFICACTHVHMCVWVCVCSGSALGISDQCSSTSSYETEHWTHSRWTKTLGEVWVHILTLVDPVWTNVELQTPVCVTHLYNIDLKLVIKSLFLANCLILRSFFLFQLAQLCFSFGRQNMQQCFFLSPRSRKIIWSMLQLFSAGVQILSAATDWRLAALCKGWRTHAYEITKLSPLHSLPLAVVIATWVKSPYIYKDRHPRTLVECESHRGCVFEGLLILWITLELKSRLNLSVDFILIIHLMNFSCVIIISLFNILISKNVNENW